MTDTLALGLSNSFKALNSTSNSSRVMGVLGMLNCDPSTFKT